MGNKQSGSERAIPANRQQGTFGFVHSGGRGEMGGKQAIGARVTVNLSHANVLIALSRKERQPRNSQREEGQKNIN